jgi:hypothetical protein
MKKIIKYYRKAWFKVEYEVGEIAVNFKAWKITGLNEETPENSEVSIGPPQITGYIKWDDCIDFKQDDHYCGMHHAEQTLMLMRSIQNFKNSLGGVFSDS